MDFNSFERDEFRSTKSFFDDFPKVVFARKMASRLQVPLHDTPALVLRVFQFQADLGKELRKLWFRRVKCLT